MEAAVIAERDAFVMGFRLAVQILVDGLTDPPITHPYLHISTRKMKYLMDHNYIPHENTGKSTHKYRILRSDVEAFKVRLETDKRLQAQLAGQFSTREPKPPK